MKAVRVVVPYVPPARGFTLVEVVVALSILSLIMLATITGLRTLANTQAAVDRMTARIDEVRSVSSFLRDTMESAVVSGGSGALSLGGGSNEARGYFELHPNSLAWKSTILIGESFGGSYLVRVAKENDSLVLRWQKANVRGEPGDWENAEARTLIVDLQEFGVAWRERHDGEWQQDWQSEDEVRWVRLQIPRLRALLARAYHAGAALMVAVSRQSGVALAIVVWFIAGMSVLVAGIVAQARVDTRMAQNHVARAMAVAAGDGAILLMLADTIAANDPLAGSRAAPPDGRYRIGAIEATVVLVPTSGLINPNTASVELLSAMFQTVGGRAGDDALALAQNVVQSRSASAVQDQPYQSQKFEALEDLLRVPGFSRTLLDSVRDFIVVGEASRGSTNWSQAPDMLLDVLGKADPAQADSVRARGDRESGLAGGQGIVASAYRVDAIVRYGDKVWLRRRWIAMESSSSSALPWRVVRTEPPRVLTKDGNLVGGSVDA